MRDRLVLGEDGYDGIDDQLADVKQGDRLQRGQQAKSKAERGPRPGRNPKRI